MQDFSNMKKLLKLKEVREKPWWQLTPAQRLARKARQTRESFAKRSSGPEYYPQEPTKTIDDALEFYESQEWKNCRKQFLSCKKFICDACQTDLSGHNFQNLNIDHIKPLRFFWDLRIDPNNLRIVCKDCNRFKGNSYEDDEWIIRDGMIRKKKPKDDLS